MGTQLIIVGMVRCRVSSPDVKNMVDSSAGLSRAEVMCNVRISLHTFYITLTLTLAMLRCDRVYWYHKNGAGPTELARQAD